MRTTIAAGMAGLALATAAPAFAQGDDAQAIRALDARWNQMIAARDVDGIVALYTNDGALMPPNAPRAAGPALRETWKGLLGLPGLKLVITPEQVEVSKAGDMAMDRGRYTLSVAGAPEDTGKYLVVWRKEGGQWKVANDIFNSDLPAR